MFSYAMEMTWNNVKRIDESRGWWRDLAETISVNVIKEMKCTWMHVCNAAETLSDVIHCHVWQPGHHYCQTATIVITNVNMADFEDIVPTSQNWKRKEMKVNPKKEYSTHALIMFKYFISVLHIVVNILCKAWSWHGMWRQNDSRWLNTTAKKAWKRCHNVGTPLEMGLQQWWVGTLSMCLIIWEEKNLDVSLSLLSTFSPPPPKSIKRILIFRLFMEGEVVISLYLSASQLFEL